MLALTALATGVLSEILVAAIEPTIEETGISEIFIGLIIVPLVGNVAEHMAAVKIAYGGNLDFAMGIAFNSALQVALGVTAVAVAAGYAFDNELVLDFKPLEIALPDRGDAARRPGRVERRRQLDRGRAADRHLPDGLPRLLVPVGRPVAQRRASE